MAYNVGYSRTIPEVVRTFYRERAHCAQCHTRLGDAMPTIVGDRIFHRACAERANARAAVLPTPVREPQIIATLRGSGGELFDRAGCSMVDRSGYSQQEGFAQDAFDYSIAMGGQRLLINHAGLPLQGRFTRLRNDGGQLLFTFILLDGAREQDILTRIRSGAIRFCSIGFEPLAYRYERHLCLNTRARLNEISLCDGRTPQWFGTWITAQ
jgi:HK97 family phage prohead protease